MGNYWAIEVQSLPWELPSSVQESREAWGSVRQRARLARLPVVHEPEPEAKAAEVGSWLKCLEEREQDPLFLGNLNFEIWIIIWRWNLVWNISHLPFATTYELGVSWGQTLESSMVRFSSLIWFPANITSEGVLSCWNAISWIQTVHFFKKCMIAILCKDLREENARVPFANRSQCHEHRPNHLRSQRYNEEK